MPGESESTRSPQWHPPGRNAVPAGAVIAALCFFTYLAKLFPSPAPGLCGAFITQAFMMEAAPAPGFSPYIVAGKLFTMIPAYSVAWRMSLMSAFFAALSIFLLYMILAHTTGRLLPAISGSCIAGFSSAFWLSAVSAHPVVLLCFFILLALYCTLKNNACWESGNHICADRLLLLIAFLLGISFTVSSLAIFFAPSILYLLFFSGKGKGTGRQLLFAAFFLLGLTPFLALFTSPVFRAVFARNPGTAISAFLDLLLYRDWGSSAFLPGGALSHWGPALAETQCLLFGSLMLNSITIAAAVFTIVGMLWSLEKKRDVALALLIGIILSGPLWLFVFRTPQTEDGYMYAFFHICVSTVITALFAGYGVHCVIESLQARLPDCQARIFKNIYITVVIVISFVPVFLHSYRLIDSAVSGAAAEYGQNVLRSLERGGVLVTSDDTATSVIRYLQCVESQRVDLKVLPVCPTSWQSLAVVAEHPELLTSKYSLDDIRRSFAMGYRGFSDPKRYCTVLHESMPDSSILYADTATVRQNQQIISCSYPQGLAVRIVRDLKGKPLPSDFAVRDDEIWAAMSTGTLERVYGSKAYIDRKIAGLYAEVFTVTGVYYGISGDYGRAFTFLERALSLLPGYPPAVENLEKVREIQKRRRRYGTGD